jgi:hypothetical protein
MSTERWIRTGAATSFLLVVGAVSAGVHAALAPEHLHEWPPLGGAFVAAAAALASAVGALALRPLSPWPPRLLGALFAGLVAAYTLTRLVALPPLDPAREPLDALGACTTALEAAGLAFAIRLGWPRERGRLSAALTTGGTA